MINQDNQTKLEECESDKREEIEPPPRPSFKISQNHASDLLSKMMQLGYFHDDCTVSSRRPQSDDKQKNQDEGEGEDIDENDHDIQFNDMKYHQKYLAERDIYGPDDKNCRLILSTSKTTQTCMTRDNLKQKIKQKLYEANGRLSIKAISADFDVSTEKIEQVIWDLVHHFEMESPTSSQDTKKGGKLHYLQREIILDTYLDEICRNDIHLLMKSNHGIITISDLARDTLKMPIEFTLKMIQDRLEKAGDDECDSSFFENVEMTTSVNGGKQLVTMEYQRRKAEQVQTFLAEAIDPISILDLKDHIEWDQSLIVEHVMRLCKLNQLDGDFHLDSATVQTNTGGIYIPHVYTKKQEKILAQFFTSNGYEIIQSSSKYGMSQGRFIEYLLELNPCAMRLDNIIIHPDVILNSVQAAVEESINSKSFVDLSMHLPERLLTNSTLGDLHLILKRVLGETKSTNRSSFSGTIVLSDGNALYFSQTMVKHIADKLIPPVVEEYASVLAKQIVENLEDPIESDDDPSGRTTTKSSIKEKKTARPAECSKRKKRNLASHVEIAGEQFPKHLFQLAPMSAIIDSLINEYPDLKEVCDEDCEEYQWLDDETGSILHTFCRETMHTKKFEDLCFRKTQVELNKILNSIKGTAVSNLSSHGENVETLFENKSCFATACYMVQLLARLPLRLSMEDTKHQEYLSKLSADFLDGCAVDFTQRIMEYCLYKHNVEDGIFLFNSVARDDINIMTVQNSFCMPIEITKRSFNKSFLSCSLPRKGGVKDPLEVLQEILPGNLGDELAQMWILCGDKTYDSSKKNTINGQAINGKVKIEKFISHVKDSCFAICGIPFKVLDKKAEKNFLATRRKELTKLLQSAERSKDVLELTVMLLFQQIRGIVVTGSELLKTHLKLLVMEKKISEAVTEKLIEASSLVQNEEEIPDDLLQFVRNCGLSRDISKISCSKQ